jgi:hypothetical protein
LFFATKQSPDGEVRAKALPQYVEAPAGLSRLLADFHVLSRGFIPASHEDRLTPAGPH